MGVGKEAGWFSRVTHRTWSTNSSMKEKRTDRKQALFNISIIRCTLKVIYNRTLLLAHIG